jgi:hypothetical protein
MPIDPRRIEVIDDTVAEIYRRMSPSERIAKGLQMNAFAKSIIEANVRRTHPDWSPEKVRQEVLRRFAGE